ncbi:MAG: segregation/condensation protein A [Nanoarchaeota archaeon]|nr:segregation/condensation protein A [Nanoarchaeota archaeon]MBU1704028.1 segregation/condensation protein A [Nanoarchaeota archaeon]
MTKKEGHEQIFDILFEKDEITWQTIIMELVKSGDMDPWDVNVSLLTKKYLDMLKQLQHQDFRVSGKVLLCAAMLLKIKSNRLMGEDLANLDRLFSEPEEIEELDFEEDYSHLQLGDEKPTLIPRMPQPRKRKVSVYDLVHALEQALEVKRRKVLRQMPPTNVHIPAQPRDISKVIKDVYGKIKVFFSSRNSERLTFSKLIPSESKEDKIYTFIPLLHLTNQRKIDVHQFQHFGEIEIELKMAEQEVNKELGLK